MSVGSVLPNCLQVHIPSWKPNNLKLFRSNKTKGPRQDSPNRLWSRDLITLFMNNKYQYYASVPKHWLLWGWYTQGLIVHRDVRTNLPFHMINCITLWYFIDFVHMRDVRTNLPCHSCISFNALKISLMIAYSRFDELVDVHVLWMDRNSYFMITIEAKPRYHHEEMRYYVLTNLEHCQAIEILWSVNELI
jgi:hypothetical protein